MTNQIYPCLWFNEQAKAAELYCCALLIHNNNLTIQIDTTNERTRTNQWVY